MPGTIQISVLDIIDLPSPSPPSSMSIKVSMGKRDYLRAEPGDLSIPLTTLRENLIVKLLDDAGNEISRAGVETRSIIEKGIWDELFPLEGGGKMHLKMQFILSEEEQSRIRLMRLSALKKKHGELVTNSPQGPDKSFERNNATSSLPHQLISRSSSWEVASRPAAVLHTEADKVTNPSLHQEHSSKVVEKTETRQPWIPKDINRGGSNGEKASSLPSNEPTTTAKTSVELRLERTPSNVRNMISVFDTSLAQDKRPRIKPPPVKPKSNTVPETEGSTKSDEQKDMKDPVNNGVSGMCGNSFARKSVVDLPKAEIQGDERKLLCGENEESPQRRSGRGWIFLEEPSSYCATALGKQAIIAVERQSSSEVDAARASIDLNKVNRGKSTGFRNGDLMPNRGGEKTFSCKQRKPENDGPAVDSSGGPLGQAVKVAVMVGFGALVLFTRQRKNW